MYPIAKENYKYAAYFTRHLLGDKVYPLSITDGFQTGEIFTNYMDNPSCYLYWHYCGFAFLAGEYDEAFICDIKNKMHNPSEGHSGRLALQTPKDSKLDKMLMQDAEMGRYERYMFEFVSPVTQNMPLNEGLDLLPVDGNNYEILSGRIVPAFSWESKEQFLRSGFGYCLTHNGKFAACAFSSALSEKYVDIGVETDPEYRGKGYGKIVVSKMIEEILRRGKTPIWQCHVSNEASKKLALSQGFKVRDVHLIYKLK